MEIPAIEYNSDWPDWLKSLLLKSDGQKVIIQQIVISGTTVKHFFVDADRWRWYKETLNKRGFTDQNGNILNRQKIIPYLSSFADGFHDGFNANKWETLGLTDETRACNMKKIALSDHGFWMHRRLIPDREEYYISTELWHKSGFNAGQWYFAWHIIAANAELFEKYFIQKKGKGQVNKAPTAGQIALFFLYLIWAKIEDEGTGKTKFAPLIKKYNFNISYKNVYNHYVKIGKWTKDDPMTTRNLAFIIRELLHKFPVAKKLASQDFYTSEREI